VPEAASAEALLRQLKSDDREMAVVVDEYGGVSGIITLHDVVEEVVGELGPHGARPLPATGPLTLPGACLVDELAERLSANVDQTGVTTVAGYLQRELGRLPRVGDRVPFGERMIEVLEAEETRVTKVRVS
jgi:CBS domain containing-hemolysin-like protein